MRDKKLLVIIQLAILFVTLHLIDHILRGDLSFPLSVESLPFIIVSLAIYGILGIGLFLYWRNKVGPRFWALTALFGVAFGWLSHFSPFTNQSTTVIRSAYQHPAAGWFALLILTALMLVLIAGALYAGYLWAREGRR